MLLKIVVQKQTQSSTCSTRQSKHIHVHIGLPEQCTTNIHKYDMIEHTQELSAIKVHVGNEA